MVKRMLLVVLLLLLLLLLLEIYCHGCVRDRGFTRKIKTRTDSKVFS
jgi:hypothetical protein